MKRRIVIVGGVAAGASAATRARRLNADAEIVVFEKGGYVSFANCGLPYYVGDIIQDRAKLLLQSPEMFKRRFNIDVHVHHEVTAINREAKRVQVTDLRSQQARWESYDRLILAPGASPILPPFAGLDAENVFVLRSMEDADAMRAFVDGRSVKRAVVVGAGFIGLETTESLMHRGIDVEIVEMAPQVLTPLDADMAASLAVYLRAKGAPLHLGHGVKDIQVANGRATGVVLQNGRSIDADLVVLSVGVRPNVKLASDAGLALGPNGGIQVNEQLETNDPAILAAGDAVEVVHVVTGRPILIPLAGPANKHGRLAGERAATDADIAAPKVAGTVIVKVFDLTVAMTGLSRRAAERAEMNAAHAVIKRGHHVGYYPGSQVMTIKLVYEPGTRRVLGAQIIGGAGVDRRIDLIATVIHFNGTVDDLAALDLAYAPQYGAAKDPVHIAAFVAGNQDRGLVAHVDPADVPSLESAGYQIVDVRTPGEFAAGAIEGAVNVGVDDLRGRLAQLDESRPVLVYCQVGQRGYVAARILDGRGRSDVKNLAGGYAEYDIQKRAAAETAEE